ncbi:MAG: hypothetical protein M1823_006234 [Watsoniomyces obsoletus]|nr:MAG: hypothetical protein M1823_006234 [Watsoniomyces obsoletus]
MITDLLPDIESIIKRFSSPRTGSIEAEIRSRAWHLARSSISDTSRCEEMDDSGVGKNSFSSTRTNQHVPSPTSGTGTGSSPKKSLERRFRKSLDIVRTKVLLRRSLDEGVEPASSSGSNEGNPLEKSIRTHYLLISPLLPPISSLATFFSNTPSTTRSSKDENADDASSSSSSSKLVRSPTLAIYGDRDIFTSYKKLQKWASELAKQPHSRFRCCEVQGAGHFWVEEGVERRLRGAVREWITLSVLRPSLAQADET